jgi:iron complex outermembrane recepter protein
MKLTLMQTVACELAWAGLTLLAAQAQKAQPDLTALQIEDLMNVDVTSASKKEQKLSKVPAAIFVITKEDIRRSGATDIPDLLRMVPGLDVAQVNPGVWAISARGFNGQYATTLLVLIDGRTVYTPIFSGVYWDAQDVPLESIERIEIIRGPGAAIWGANAVNGVINVTTSSARDTQNGIAAVTAGTLEHGSGMLRYGGSIGNYGAYRVFADSFQAGHFLTPDHQNAEDDWYRFHGGFRVDTNLSTRDSLTIEGEAIRGNEGEWATTFVSLLPPSNATVNLRDRFSGWDVLARWKRTNASGSESSLQIYFDRSNRGDSTYGLGLNTLDLDFQHQQAWGSRQDLVWGLGYRVSSDHTAITNRFSFTPQDLTTQIFSAFVQDQIAVLPDRLYLTLGTRAEHEYYNGFNLQPTARVTWTPDSRSMLWAAVSGAQGTPSRANTSIRYNYGAYPGPDNLAVLVSLFGNFQLLNTSLTATEAGLRTQVSDKISFDSTIFFNHYHHLVSEVYAPPVLETSPLPAHLLEPIYLANQVYGETHGIELFASLKLADRWTISPGYAFLTMHLHRDADSNDTNTVPQTEGGFPGQQAQLRSNVNLAWHWQWTTSVYFVGRLPAAGIPSYTRLDTNLAWQPSEKIALVFGGQDLARDLHQEYSGPDLTVLPSLVPRSAYARLTWHF